MFIKFVSLAALLLTSVALAAKPDSLGGQVILCASDNPSNSSLIAYDGLKKFGFSGTDLGSDYQTAMNGLIGRFDKFSPLRASVIQKLLPKFEERAAHLHGVDFINNKDWDDDIVPSGCEVRKVIFYRVQTRPEDREFLINEDLWRSLSPSTQASLIIEQLLLHSDFKNISSKLPDVRNVIAFLADKDLDAKRVFDFVHFSANNTSQGCVDFLGAEVGARAFLGSSMPKRVSVCGERWDNQSIRIQNSLHGILARSDIEVDEDLNVRAAKLVGSKKFKLRTGKEVYLGMATHPDGTEDYDSYSTFDSEGYPLSGYLGKPAALVNINNEPVTCELRRTAWGYKSSYITFAKEGGVTECLAAPNTRTGGLVLLKATDLQWCLNPKTCPNKLENYFDFRTHTGKFELLGFPTRESNMSLKVIGFEDGQIEQPQYDPNTSNYGDFKLTISEDNNAFFGDTINVFTYGNLASAELKSPVRYQSWDLAASGSCGFFSGKSFVSTMKFFRGGNLMEGVQNPRKVRIQLDDFGNTLMTTSVCP